LETILISSIINNYHVQHLLLYDTTTVKINKSHSKNLHYAAQYNAQYHFVDLSL